MTADELNWDDDLPPETEAEVYQALLRALRRKQGFGLFFVQCTESQGEKLVANLRRDLPQQSIQEMPLQGEVTALYDQVATLWQQQSFDVLMVKGLQASLYAYEDTKRLSGWSSSDIYNYSWKGVPKILNHLNQQRDRFRDDFPARFVFLMPPFVVDYFIQRAADFLDWRSGLFRFPRDPNEIAQDADRLIASADYDKYLTLTPQERIEKILELKTLQEDCLDPTRKARLLFELGLLFYAEKDYENSIASWDKALHIKPDYHQAWYNRGIALANLGRDEEAIASYDQTLHIKPDYHQAWDNRGVALAALGRKEEAITSFDKAIEIKPDFASAHYNKACYYALQGKIEPAVESLQVAIHLDAEC